MKTRRAIAFVAVCALAGLSAGCDAASRGGVADKLRKAVTDALKDPASAQYRKEFLSESDDDRKVLSLCGELNSKNGYGGYGGFSRFISSSTGVVMLEGDERTAIFPSAWATWCGRPVKP